MFGYYTSLLNTYKKKISLYIVLGVMILCFVALTVVLKIVGEYWIESNYVILTPIVSFLFMPIYWFMFYNNIYKNLNKSNLEMLSFTTGLSRTKIFFAKAFVFLTLAFILSIISAILISVPTYITYQNDFSKIIHAFLGTILIGTFGGWAFYFCVFFVDTLTKNPKRKRSLAWAPLTVVLGLVFVPFAVNGILGATVKSPHYVGKGMSDFQDSIYVNNDFQKTEYISTTESSTYRDYDNQEDKKRDVSYYNKQTAIAKSVGVLTNYLNLKNVFEKAQGIGKIAPKESYHDYSPFDQPIFNHREGIDQSFFNNVLSIDVKYGGKQSEKLYLKHHSWNWDHRYDEFAQQRKFAYEREIELLVEKLKSNPEFQKNQPNFMVLKKFLIEEMDKAFSKPEFQQFEHYSKGFEQPPTPDPIKPNENTEKRINPNYPSHNPNWVLSYIYLKANPQGKTLLFDYVMLEFKNNWHNDVKESRSFVDSNGNIHSYDLPYNNESYDRKIIEEADESLQFLNGFTNPQKIFASREITSDYEYPWINWVLIVVIIIGMGYWSLERYNRKDVA